MVLLAAAADAGRSSGQPGLAPPAATACTPALPPKTGASQARRLMAGCCRCCALPAELRTAYEGLSHENQRLQQSLTELTRELQARDAGALCSNEEYMCMMAHLRRECA